MFRIALLAVPFASALAFSPRLTMEQYELPKHAAILLLAAVLVAARPRLLDPRTWLTHPPLAGLLGALTLSAFISPAPFVSFLGHYENLEGALTLATYGIFFLAGASASPRLAERFSLAVIIAAALCALYALMQQAGLDPFPGEYFRHVRSFAGNPDFLAQQMAMAIPLAAGLALTSARLGPMLATALFLLVLFLTSSRAGAAAGITALALILWLKRETLARNTMRLALAAGALAAALVLSQMMASPGYSLSSRLAHILSPAGFAQSRGMLWLGSARVAREAPLLGCGTDMLGGCFLKHAPHGWASLEGLGTTARKAHNEPLHILATAGAVGLGCYLWLLLWALNKWKAREDSPLRAPAGAALAAYLLHNLASFGTAVTSPVFWLLLGWICSPQSPKSAERSGSRLVVLPAVLLLGFFAVLRMTADGYGFRGNEADRKGDLRGTVAMFAKSSSLAPWEATYMARLGWGLEREGRMEEARREYERAFRIIPVNGLFLGNTGRVMFSLATKSGSETAANEAFAVLLGSIEMAPSQPTLYGAAIMAAQKMGLKEEQEKLIGKLLIQDSTWAMRMLSGQSPTR